MWVFVCTVGPNYLCLLWSTVILLIEYIVNHTNTINEILIVGPVVTVTSTITSVNVEGSIFHVI